MKYLLTWLILAPVTAMAQHWEWVHAAGGDRVSGAIRMNVGRGICADDDGNIYTAGCFAGTTRGRDSTTAYGIAPLLMKYDTAGNVLWLRKITDGQADHASAVCVDRAENVCVTGIESGEGINGFIAKYDRDGSMLWIKETKGEECQVTMNAVATDRVGNIYVAGDCKGVTDIDSFSVGVPGKYTLFVVKYDVKGHVLWVRRSAASNSYYTQITGLAIDPQEHVYVTGMFEDSLQLGAERVTGIGGVDIFVARLTSDGRVDRLKTWGSKGADKPGNIAVDDAGNCYLTAFFTEEYKTPLQTLKGENLLKLSPDGELLWNLQIGVAEHDYMVGCYVAVDGNGDPGITGYVYGATPIFGNSQIFANGGNDIFVAKCNAKGKLLWQMQAGGSGADEGLAICADKVNNLYVTGYFHEQVNFDRIVVRTVSGDDGMWVGKILPK